MKSLFMALGYTSYQAGCVVPIIAAFIVGTVIMGYIEFKGWL